MQKISLEEIESMDKRFRTDLINSLWGVRPAVLVATENSNGQSNLAIFNSVIHIGAHPPLVGLIFRPDSADRHTLTNILEQRFYSLNFFTKELINKAHQTSARYPKDISEFDSVDLTIVRSEDLSAPFVNESPLVIDVCFREKVDIQLNGTHMVIGELQRICIKEDSISADGWIDHDLLGTIGAGGLDSYYSHSFEKRMEYAKPDLPPREKL